MKYKDKVNYAMLSEYQAICNGVAHPSYTSNYNDCEEILAQIRERERRLSDVSSVSSVDNINQSQNEERSISFEAQPSIDLQ